MTDAVAERGVAQLRQLRRVGQIGEADTARRFSRRGRADLPGLDRVRAEITLQRDRRRPRPAAELRSGTSISGGQPLEIKAGIKLVPGAIREVKRAAMRIENADRAFDDQAMQIVRPDDVAKGFAEAVEEIEDEVFLDLDFLLRALELANPPALPLIGEKPADERRRQAARKRRRRMEPKPDYFAGLS